MEEPEKTRRNGDFGVEELLRTMRSRFAKILVRFRIPAADRDDLVQEVMIQFLYKRRHVRNPESWLGGALSNQCRMYWRTRSRRRTTAVDEAILELLAGADDSDPERRVLRSRLSRQISTLPNNCQSLLRMRYKLGMDVEETAQRTGYKPSSIDKVTKRCVDKLSRKLVAAGLARKPRHEGPRT